MDFAAELTKFSRIAEEKGLVNSLEGNLSLIDRSTGYIYITPSHKSKALLTPEQVCVVDDAGNQIAGDGRRSSEFFLHQAAYQARPDVSAIVHCHPPYLTARAFACQDIETPKKTLMHEVFGTIQCMPFGAHGTHEVHQGIEEALNGRPVALLGGHGVVCVAEDLEAAIGIVEAAENYIKTLTIMEK